MCGIAGFTQSHSHVFDESVIHRMTRVLQHRGPDQQGCVFTPHVALGAVRLQVVDLHGGDQPFRSDDGRTIIAYNGEIFNHGEVRAGLESRGHRFRSSCDTEVALRAFLEWDTGCFRRLRGMFALAIWSEDRKRLVLARDRMGIKPLYLRRSGRHLIFGSELKALFEHPRVTRVLDPVALQDYLSLNYIPSPRTLVQGIGKLPSGHFLDWRDGQESITAYWKPVLWPDKSITETDAAEQLDHLLRDAVRENMVSDVPLGVWASGGLDSSTLLHYASEQSSQPLKTFSIAFEAPSCDESRWFREVARRYGTSHHEFELNRNTDITTAIEQFAWYSDEPGADAGALPVWYLAKMTREHVTVALSGEGGDELFGGYLTYQADRLAQPLRAIPGVFRRAALRTAHAVLPVSNEKVSFEYKLKRWLEGSLLEPDAAHLFWNGAFTPEQKRQLLPHLGRGGNSHLYAGLPTPDSIGSLNRFMLLDQKYYLQDNLLYKVDRMSMAHSLEVRPPLLDHRIVEFAASLPEHLKIRGKAQKLILKKTMRGKLPDAILDRKKSGLDIPAHEWFRGPLAGLLRDTMSSHAIRNTSFFDRDVTETLLRDHTNKRINAGYQLWGLLTLFLWLKRWNIEVPDDLSMRASDLAEAS